VFRLQLHASRIIAHRSRDFAAFSWKLDGLLIDRRVPAGTEM